MMDRQRFVQLLLLLLCFVTTHTDAQSSSSTVVSSSQASSSSTVLPTGSTGSTVLPTGSTGSTGSTVLPTGSTGSTVLPTGSTGSIGSTGSTVLPTGSTESTTNSGTFTSSSATILSSSQASLSSTILTTVSSTGLITQSTKAPDTWNWDKNYQISPYDPERIPYLDDFGGKGYRRPGQGPESPEDLGQLNIFVRDPRSGPKARSLRPFGFPVARYNRRGFPLNGPFFQPMPRIPIFADKLTRQTIIYSPAGGVYIIPPLINFYGKLFSVAELIASGYASLVSTGVPPPNNIDVASFVKPGPVSGSNVPKVNPATGSFVGGVRTEFGAFPAPKYPMSFDDDGNSKVPQQVRGKDRQRS